ncbi:MAG: branched-chain amino acid ABC transporter permease, partial [Paracoccaceae bacterium]
MKKGTYIELFIVLCAAVAASFWPFLANGYMLGIGVDVMMYTALATSWVLFSGPTHYISLASAAFFGIGGFFVGLGMSDYEMSFWSMLCISAVIGAVVAALVGVATLRLSGVYFVIFTLGLAEMIRNLVSWIQNNFLGSRGLYVFTDFTDKHLFWMLLIATVLIYCSGWIISRSRLGLALRVIGGDETVAKHVGINTAYTKIVLFTTTGFFGAIIGLGERGRDDEVGTPLRGHGHG